MIPVWRCSASYWMDEGLTKLEGNLDGESITSVLDSVTGAAVCAPVHQHLSYSLTGATFSLSVTEIPVLCHYQPYTFTIMTFSCTVSKITQLMFVFFEEVPKYKSKLNEKLKDFSSSSEMRR